MLLVHDYHIENSHRFQSSSSPKAGCYTSQMAFSLGKFCFNPHPARRLDAIRGRRACRDLRCVSILIQPEGWMLSSYGEGVATSQVVSILIQPEGWMLSSFIHSVNMVAMFQSSSSPKAGCYPIPRRTWFMALCFNPHPARRLDAMRRILFH